MTALTPVSGRRRRADRVARGGLMVLTGVALIPLVLVVYYLLKRGLGALSWDFFTTDPTGSFLGNPGGIKSAILGTIEMVAFATLIAVPIGIGVALFLTEYGKNSLFARAVRYFVDVMTGVPSIVFGLFIYIVLILSGAGGSGYAGWKGSVALALLMLPVVTRAAEVVLLLVPDSLREAALALGATRWEAIRIAVLPYARAGIVGATMLGLGRALGETMAVTMVIGNSPSIRASLFAAGYSLPAVIANEFAEASGDMHTGALAALGLLLFAVTVLLNVVARLLVRMSRRGPVRVAA
jgi:phosphate transport system permease protein